MAKNNLNLASIQALGEACLERIAEFLPMVQGGRVVCGAGLYPFPLGNTPPPP